MDMVRRRVTVRGQVQGVGFRANARAKARRLGLVGFARNLPNGDVELEVQGGDDAIRLFLEWAGTGPRYASVTSVTVEELPPLIARGDGFSVT
jgi:acylphosphatase